VNNGILRITGTPDGTTAGIYWKGSQTYGRWEVRARFPAGCGCYHPVLTLWPSDENWPVGGEIDYAEVFDSGRQKLRFFLHYGAENNVIGGYRAVDMRQWHNFAVEWTPDHITGYVDGEAFFRTSNRTALPPGRMHQTIQLDWYPGDTRGGAVLDVDWARKYAL
jgi:beta-glucanase (GH16 family)